MIVTAPQLIWRASGEPAPGGKTGSKYRLEPASGNCATCAAPIGDGVPFSPRRSVAGIDNDTFSGHAEYARFGTHVCSACAWLYGEPKRNHRSVLAIGEHSWWPMLGKSEDADRPRWRNALGSIGRAAQSEPMTGVLTTDPKPRLWPRARIATCGSPGLYVHSPDHDWSAWSLFDLRTVATALALVDRARALGATKTACWRGLHGSGKLVDKVGLDAIIALDEALAPFRGTAELLIAVLVA